MGLGALLGHGPKFQKLHIHSLSIPGRRKWPSFCCMGNNFRGNGWFSKNVIFGHETCMLGHWPKFQKLHIYSLSPRSSKLSSFSLYGQMFMRYWASFKTVIFRHNSRSCTYTLFLLQRVEIELIFPLRAAVSKIRANFQDCHNWAWNLANGQSSRSCTYTT